MHKENLRNTMKKEMLIPQHLVDLMNASKKYLRIVNAAYMAEEKRIEKSRKDVEMLQMLEKAQESAVDTLSNIGSYIGDILTERMLS